MHFSVDASEVHELTVDLSRAPERLRRNLGEVWRNEADALLRDMKRQAEGHRYLPKFASKLSKEKQDELDYIVGFNKTGQGELANIIVFPSGGARNAPVYDFYGPINRRIGPFVEHLGRIAEDSVFTGPAEL